MSTSTATPMIATLSSRIQTLEPKLRKIASRFSTDPIDQEDIFSEIVEAILTKCKPEFSDAMILTKAKWVAHDHINQARIYTKYVSDETVFQASSEDDETQDGIEFYNVDAMNVVGSSFQNPEDALIADEENSDFEKAIANLSPSLQVIVHLLKQGFKPVEISQKLGVSKSAVSQNMKIISKALININITINS